MKAFLDGRSATSHMLNSSGTLTLDRPAGDDMNRYIVTGTDRRVGNDSMAAMTIRSMGCRIVVNR